MLLHRQSRIQRPSVAFGRQIPNNSSLHCARFVLCIENLHQTAFRLMFLYRCTCLDAAYAIFPDNLHNKRPCFAQLPHHKTTLAPPRRTYPRCSLAFRCCHKYLRASSHKHSLVRIVIISVI